MKLRLIFKAKERLARKKITVAKKKTKDNKIADAT